MLCQSCIERQLPPNEAIGLWQGYPICDSCLTPLMDNMINTPSEDIKLEDTLEYRKELALKQFQSLLDLTETWPLSAEETLTNRDDFFNFRAPALVNLDLKQLSVIIEHRKAVLYSIRIETEKIQELIDRIKADERSKVQGLSIEKALKVKGKISSAKSDDLMKLAKMMAKTSGKSVDECLALINNEGAIGRQVEFKGLLENKRQSTKLVSDDSTAGILKGLQEKVKAEGPGNSQLTKKVVRCANCQKITCICK